MNNKGMSADDDNEDDLDDIGIFLLLQLVND